MKETSRLQAMGPTEFNVRRPTASSGPAGWRVRVRVRRSHWRGDECRVHYYSAAVSPQNVLSFALTKL